MSGVVDSNSHADEAKSPAVGLEAEAEPPAPEPRPLSPVSKVLESENHFLTLELPLPACNELGKPTWTVPNDQIKKQFRKVSLRVHPDKNYNSDNSQLAFQTVREAFDCLKDPSTRTVYINEYYLKNKDKMAWKPSADLESSIEQQIQQRKQKEEQEKNDVEHFQSKLSYQLKSRMQKARNPMHKKRTIRLESSSDDSDDDDVDDEVDGAGSIAAKIRKKARQKKKFRGKMF